MTRKADLVSAGIWGPKRWGKSALLEGIAREATTWRSVNRVFFVDPTRRMFHRPGFEAFGSFTTYLSRVKERRSFPRLSVHGYGLEREPYALLVEHIMETSRPTDDTFLIVDEAHILAPAIGPHVAALCELSTIQRGFANDRDDVCRCHLVVSSQRPTAVRTALRENLDSQIFGRFTGRSTLRLVEDQFGAEAVARLDKLRDHEWCVLEGEMPAHVRHDDLP